jgi:hypothetical protein
MSLQLSNVRIFFRKIQMNYSFPKLYLLNIRDHIFIPFYYITFEIETSRYAAYETVIEKNYRIFRMFFFEWKIN